MSKIDVDAVLIADPAADRNDLALDRMDLECVEAQYLEHVVGALETVCRGVAHYEDPKAFIDNISRHQNDVVLSIWSGMKSRNRKALVSSICEAYGIAYIGADTYTQVLCQDKALAKRFAAKHGLAVAADQLITSATETPRIRLLDLPVVIKPNFEGGSIGISQSNLVHDHDEAEALTLRLLEIFQQPVLVEEFISGREISLVYAGHGKTIQVAEAVELVIGANPTWWKDSLYGYELKKSEEEIAYEQPIVTPELPQATLDVCAALFAALDKVDLIRIDGRYHDGVFTLIELSPDAHLGHNTTTSLAFKAAGYEYEQMFELLVRNAIMACRSHP
jgi:D-alanine-D-alanine ligase